MLMKFAGRVAAGPDRNDTSADGAGTVDVKGCVADHKHFLALQIVIEQPASAIARDRGNAGAVFAVVTKGASFKAVPQAVIHEFDLGTEANVAGEQSDRGR